MLGKMISLKCNIFLLIAVYVVKNLYSVYVVLDIGTTFLWQTDVGTKQFTCQDDSFSLTINKKTGSLTQKFIFQSAILSVSVGVS